MSFNSKNTSYGRIERVIITLFFKMEEDMIHHFEIYVENLEASKKFYSLFLPLLGYKLFQEWNKGVSYKYQESYIVFVQVEEKYKDFKYHRKHVGINHLALKCFDKEIFDKIRKILEQEKVQLLDEHQYPFSGGENHYAFYF